MHVPSHSEQSYKDSPASCVCWHIEFMKELSAIPVCLLLCAGERDAAFSALGEMAGSLAAVGCQEGFEGYLGATAAQVRLSSTRCYNALALGASYNVVQFRTVQYITVQHIFVQYINARYSTTGCTTMGRPLLLLMLSAC